MDLAFWLSLIVFLITVPLHLDVAIGSRRIRQLRDLPPAPPAVAPRVSIILSALNEEDTIEPALQSVLALDYPNLEIIAINDRSTDGTGAILDRLARQHPRLRVLHIRELPPGWLGKTHALYQGAQLAGGDYLIFTDADVVYAPTAVSRAVQYCERQGVDHLALLFEPIMNSRLLEMLMLSVAVGFLSRFKPWKVHSSPKHFIGIGAFNMVSARAYRATGGHEAIRLSVLDDMMLGKLIKTGGYRQHVLYGNDLVAVEWYRNTPQMVRGMEKNVFAAFDYQFVQLVAVTLLVLLLRVWPWLALFVTDGFTRLINAGTVVAGLLLFWDMIRAQGGRYVSLVFAPLVPFIEIAIWWRACLLTVLRGGIEWRGTYYKLDELRRGQL